MRESGSIVYKCLPGQHDDLGISCAMVNWAARHPHLEWWMGNMLAARRPKRSAADLRMGCVWLTTAPRSSA